LGYVPISPDEYKKRNSEYDGRIDPKLMNFIERYNRRAEMKMTEIEEEVQQ